jgi:hypothetical protein
MGWERITEVENSRTIRSIGLLGVEVQACESGSFGCRIDSQAQRLADSIMSTLSSHGMLRLKHHGRCAIVRIELNSNWTTYSIGTALLGCGVV